MAFYSGYKMKCKNHGNEEAISWAKKGNAIDQTLHQDIYTLAMGIDNLCITLPLEAGNDVSKYNATLGHKANHGFEPNTKFHIFSVHPILGKTKMLVAMKEIPAGSEITVDYGYDKSPVKPTWFLQQFEEYSKKMQAEIMQRFPMFLV